MEYSHFSMANMVAVLSCWVDSKENRVIFSTTPELMPMLPHLDALYLQLGQIRSKLSKLSPKMRLLSRKVRQLDGIHNRKLRGLYNVLTDLIMLTDDSLLAADLYQMRDSLFPEGARGLGERHRKQTDFPILAETRITDRMRKMLTETAYNGRTLLEDYEDWIVTSKELGYLDNEQATRYGEDLAQSAIHDDARNARIRWNRLVKTVVNLMEVVSTVDEQAKSHLLEPLKCAEETTLRQAKQQVLLNDDDLNVRAAMSAIEATQRNTPVGLL